MPAVAPPWTSAVLHHQCTQDASFLRRMEALLPLRPALRSSLHAAARWFGGMVDPATHRLHYAYSVSQARVEDRSCPVRDIGTAADLAVLSAAIDSREFDQVIGSTLEHYQCMLVRQGGPPGQAWAYVAGGQAGLGEPSSVAHSGMMLLALAAWGPDPAEAERCSVVAELAAGIMHQQRADGSFAIYFEPAGSDRRSDSGWQLYGGEAAFALATAYGRLHDARLLAATSSALRAYQAKYRRGEVDREELVFFANWQCAAGGELHAHSRSPEERSWAAAYLAELQDDIIGGGFYAEVKQAPEEQAVVEVACALEGLAHCLSVCQACATSAAQATAEGGAEGREEAERQRRRLERYAACARAAVCFLLEAQVREGPGVPSPAVGGFPHTLRPGSGQRVDVTGHVCCAFIKLLGLLNASVETEE